MKNKKLAIIGKGTAGSISIGYFAPWVKDKVDWYYDPSTPEQSVGEGTTLSFSEYLSSHLNLSYKDFINNLDGTPKIGIRKLNYKGTGDFIHGFPVGHSGVHFNANKFQNFILQKCSSKINLIPRKISNPSEVDASYIIDCSGKPNNYNEYTKVDSIPVNSVHIVQCKWNKPEFNYTLTIARPYGWVFGVPLQNRCSIGYLYNKNINTLEEVKEDIKEIFKQFNLTPSLDLNSFSFNNYYRKENFTDRVSYNGNASFFLEPIEATSINTILHTLFNTEKLLKGYKTKEEVNYNQISYLKEVEQMITLHYYAGSRFNTPFWKYAYKKSLNCMEEMTSNPKFQLTFNELQDNFSSPLTPDTHNFGDYGTWGSFSYAQNLINLDILDKISKLVNKNHNYNLFL